MPVYAYKGFATNGRAVSGTRDAESARSIKQLLRRDGVFITDLREATTAQPEKARRTFEFRLLRPRVSTQHLAVATRQLATLVGAGIPLVESLNALIEQVDDEHFKSVWAEVKQKVNEGTTFGDALAAHPRVFSGLFVNMVRAGESSGALEVVLNRLADFTESQADLRSKVLGTMFYPIIMIFMASVVTGILFTFVIPKIARIFEARRVILPLPTQVMIALSSFVKNWWWAVIPAVVLAIVGFRHYIRSERGRPWWDSFTLRAPFFGELILMVAMARFAKTLSTLLASGVPLLTAFDIVKNVLQNRTLADVIDLARDRVKEGESIAAPIKRSGRFPPIVTHMIAVGEQSGQLEQMLENIARAYEAQVEVRLRIMTAVIEPVMIVVLGVIVAFIVFSILLPMQQLTGSV